MLSAGITQSVDCWHGTFQEPSFPGPKATQNLGRPMQRKAWKLGSMGVKSWKTGSSIPQEQTDGAGSDGTQQTLQEHPQALLQSQRSLRNIRHPQKLSFETKANRFAPAHPKLWGIPQEQECYARARPGFSALMAGPRGRRWEEEPTGSPVRPTSSPGGLQEANFD